jgi:hypothetical protein
MNMIHTPSRFSSSADENGVATTFARKDVDVDFRVRRRIGDPSIMAVRTPTLMALTGGLSIQMMPMSPRFSNLPCMNVSNGKPMFLASNFTSLKCRRRV